MGCGSSKGTAAPSVLPQKSAIKASRQGAEPAESLDRPPPRLRESTLMTASDLQFVSQRTNVPLNEVNLLYLRFKLLVPTPSGLIPVRAFHNCDRGSVGAGFRHNAVLSKFVKTKYMDDDMLQFGDFVQLMKWWKLADVADKLGCVFDLYDLNEDMLLSEDVVDDVLHMLNRGNKKTDVDVTVIRELLLEETAAKTRVCRKTQFITTLHEFPDLHKDILLVSDKRIFNNKGEQMPTGIMRERSKTSESLSSCL